MTETNSGPAIELAVQDAAGVRVAAEVGADRVELCSALDLGGLTPSIGLVESAVVAAADAGLPGGVHVLIRPRPGNFEFDEHEVSVMLRDVRSVITAGAAGVVIGALTEAGAVDRRTLERLVDAAEGAVEVTFHRAIDVSADSRAAVEALIGRGVTRVLTSGRAPTAPLGVGMLELLAECYGEDVQIMAGAGITPGNVRAIADTGVAAVHFSAKRTGSADVPAAPRGVDFGGYDTTDPALAAATIAALRGA